MLFALGIRFVGETTAKYLAAHFQSLDAIMAASHESLIEAEEVGGKIAEAIIEYFANEDNRAIIERLRQAGVQFEAEQQQTQSQTLAGLNFVISGSFENHSRDELKALIEAHGGKNLAAVSANTSYLLAGNKIGPAKLQKATKLGVKIISEEEFLAMISNITPTKENTTQRDDETVPSTTAREPQPMDAQPIQGSLF